MRALIALLLLSLTFSFMCGSSKAAVFFDENFEGHLYPNWMGYNGCINASSPDGVACGTPTLSSELPFQGTKGLKGDWCHSDFTQCGTYIYRLYPRRVDEVWGRVYFRMQPGFTPSPGTTKLFDFEDSQPDGPTHNFWIEFLFGSYDIKIQAAGVPVNDQLSAKVYDPNVGNGTLSPGHWYCIEVHLKNNTPGTSNGLIEMWLDGVQIMSYPNQIFVQSGVNNINMRFDTLKFYVQDGFGTAYYDNAAVGTTRIGCSSSGVAPQAPTDLTVH